MPSLQFVGATVSLVNPPADIRETFERRFTSFYVSQDPSSSEATIHFHHREKSPVEPSWIRPSFSWKRTRPLYGDLQGSMLYLTDGDSISITDLSKSTCDFYLSPFIHEDPVFYKRTFLLIPLLEILKSFGSFYVHGSLVIRKDEGVLLLGKGGSGKTTLSHRLLENGGRWVSDDNMLLRIDERGLPTLHAFEQEFSLHPDLAKRIGAPGYLEFGKYRIPHALWPEAERATFGTPTLIADLEGMDREPMPISKSILLGRLIQENPTVWIPHRQHETLRAYQVLLQTPKAMAFRGDWRSLPPLTYFWSDV